MARWEEDCLVRTLVHMTCASYAAAAEELGYFWTNVARSANPELNITRPDRKCTVTVAQLWDGLSRLRSTD